MSGTSRLTLALVLAFLSPAAAPAGRSAIHHDLDVRLDPARHSIEVRDAILLPDRLADAGDLRFVLHAGLTVRADAPEWTIEELGEAPSLARYGINEDRPGAAGVPLREYRLRPRTAGDRPARPPILRYAGVIHHPLVQEGEEYARSFSRTPGLIDERGAVLSGSTFWVPLFGEGLVTFRLDIDLPSAWDAVSQGRRLEHVIDEGRRHVTWDSPEPMDEIYLVAAPFVETDRNAGGVTAMAFLREDDPNLAAKYLEATAQYIEMYRKLIGPYPYSKFALVENFWETGYGMPSFTLLGPKIIRFPFILQSSYPHEILHNWWGNSVFVDYESGNWCEGLTAYLADHLIKEGQGLGSAYRRDTLERYSSYVRESRDFPLVEFRSRHSSATEAIGYGKSLMLWHMLRRKLGDETFTAALAHLYRDHKFKKASFRDIEQVFSDVSGEDLGPFFRQWVTRTGAPAIELGEVSVRPLENGGEHIELELRQIQTEDPFVVDVPVAITVSGEEAARIVTVPMTGRTARLDTDLPAQVIRIDVDPQFDLFRRLDPREVPPTLSRLFGAAKVTLVVPEADAVVPAALWREFADSWARGDAHDVAIVAGSELEALPEDRAIWVLGGNNRWGKAIAQALAARDVRIGEQAVLLGERRFERAGTSFVLTAEHPHAPDLAIGWIFGDIPPALPGLARKLPHYGRYSYLAFTGEEPTNSLKGRWDPAGSPMVRQLRDGTRAALPPREPLARPAPVFDAERMIEEVRWLAAPEREGRGVGSDGLRKAADRVARAFERAGLAPGGDDGSYFQVWSEADGPGGRPVTLRNVIGVLPGTREDWSRQSVIIGAHLDHLDHGWPDVHAGDEGKLHPGADDNASGVAVMLEVARLLATTLKPPRTVVFVAFDGEEWGLRGSRHYVETMRRWPASQAIAMINLDTVGRLEGGQVTIFGAATATEWPHIAMGIGFTTGVKAKVVADDPGGSDQRSFVEAGVPAVQLFGSAHEDYHRPTDTPDKLIPDDLVSVATFVREAAVYLSERPEPLTPAGERQAGAPTGGGGRRVSLGTLPDFTFPGPGVRVTRVTPGSPAEKAGLAAGDLIVAIDGTPVEDVRGYAQILRQHAPGDRVRIEIERDGEQLTLEATLAAR